MKELICSLLKKIRGTVNFVMNINNTLLCSVNESGLMQKLSLAV